MSDTEISLAFKILIEGLRNKTEQKLYEPRFTMSATGIGYRRMTNWGKEGLIPGVFEKGKWRRFSYLELTWFGIVKLLRNFDLPIGIIGELKKALWEEVSSWELFQYPGIREVMDQLATLDNLEPGYADFPDETIRAMKEDKHCWLFFLLMDALLLRNHYMILINREGKFAPLKMGSTDEYSKFFNLPEFIANSFVSVSLTEVIRKSALMAEVQVMFEELSLLTPKQVDILSLLRNGQLSSLKVMDTSGREFCLVEESKDLDPDPADELLKRILTNTCHSLSATSNDGKSINEEIKPNNEFFAVSNY